MPQSPYTISKLMCSTIASWGGLYHHQGICPFIIFMSFLFLLSYLTENISLFWFCSSILSKLRNQRIIYNSPLVQRKIILRYISSEHKKPDITISIVYLFLSVYSEDSKLEWHQSLEEGKTRWRWWWSGDRLGELTAKFH